MDIAIRQLTEADIIEADQVLRAAFKTPESRAGDLRRCLALQPDGFLAAICGDVLVGTVGAVDYGPFAYVGLMAVQPEFQGRGIGHALMQRIVNWLDTRNVPMSLLDATIFGAPIYTQFGFVDQDQACLFQLCGNTPRPFSSEQVYPLQSGDIESLRNFDMPIYGADRARLFQLLHADFPGRAFVTRDAAGRVSGYLFAQTRRIGPWAARRPQGAQTLLQAALSLTYEGAPAAIAPRMNSAAKEMLEQVGFQFVRTARHMRRGGSRLINQRDLIYGQTSFGLG